MFNIPFINKPLGWVIEAFSKLFGGSFAWAVLFFTLFINLILIPLSIKSQKSAVQQARIKPKLDDLKKRFGNDRQKLSQETQKLYQQEGVTMSGGCLPMLLRLFIMLCIYNLILSPLTYMAGIKESEINTVSTAITAQLNEIKPKDEDDKEANKKYNDILKGLGWQENGRFELSLVGILNDPEKEAVLVGEGDKCLFTKEEFESNKKLKKAYESIKKQNKESGIDYKFIVEDINLTESPDFDIDIVNAWKPIWLMPILAFASQIISSLMSMKINKKNNPDAPTMMGMMLTMPLISLFIGFGFPGGVTFYWACSSLVSGIIQIGVQYFYGPQKMLAKTRSKELTAQCDFEAKQLQKLGEEE